MIKSLEGDSRVLLEVKGLSKRYGETNITALDSIDLSLEEGEILGIVGESGAGKSSGPPGFSERERQDVDGEVSMGGGERGVKPAIDAARCPGCPSPQYSGTGTPVPRVGVLSDS